MARTVRTATIAAPTPVLTGAATSTPTSFGELLGILSDRQTLIFRKGGSEEAAIGVSTDGGATITWGTNFGGGSRRLLGFIEVGNELLVSTQDKNATPTVPGRVIKTTGWNKATGATTSYATVKETAGLGVQFDGRWGFNQTCVVPAWSSVLPGAIFICEYGLKVSEQITAGRSGDTGAVYAYMSTDNGSTWTTIFNLRDKFPGLNAQLHTHGIAPDPYEQRVLITSGDGGFSDGAANAVWACDMAELTGVTASDWTAVADTQGTDGKGQNTTIFPMPSQILLLTDSSVGAVRRLARRGHKRPSNQQEVLPMPSAIIGADARQVAPGFPVWLTGQLTSISPSSTPAVWAVLPDGRFVEAYRGGTVVTSGSRGLVGVCGPDINGKVYGNQQLSGTTVLWSADYTP